MGKTIGQWWVYQLIMWVEEAELDSRCDCACGIGKAGNIANVLKAEVDQVSNVFLATCKTSGFIMSDTFLMVGFILGQSIIILQITEIDGVRSPSPAITMRQLRSFVLLSQFIVLVFFLLSGNCI